MNRELEIWRFAAERLRRGEPATLLVVAESAGSSPGRQGFKMIVAGGEMIGSIGGGVMEMRLVEIAKESQIADSRFQIVEQIHRKNASEASGMICSGKQTVIFLRLDASHLKTVRATVRALRRGSAKTLRIANGELRIGEMQNDDFDFRFERKSAGEFLYEEKLGCRNRLFIVGGGHCALALSELMSKMDFHVTLFDDRPGLNTIAKNRFAHRKKILESYEAIGEFVPSGARHFVVVMTLGYKSDRIVIEKLLDKNFPYFAVLGSRAKMKTLLADLEKNGAPPEKLNRISTPAGLPINSRTPFEIAVSIAAEIIKIKNSES